MSRTKALLAAIQEDDELFLKLCTEIDQFGPYAIHNLGLISHTTIFKYKRREPVDQAKEDDLVESIRLLKEARKEQGEQKRGLAREVLFA